MRTKIFYILALVSIIAYLFFHFQGNSNWGGILLLCFFMSLAIAFRSNKFLKGFSYTLMIFSVVSMAMYHPEYFITVGDFKLSSLITPLLQIIMFGMGTELSVKDFARVLKMPKGIIIGVAGHYVIMPVIGFTVAKLFNFPPEIAAGILLVGCCPSGLASNVMSYLAKANLALSVSLTAVSTILAPFVTPAIMNFLGGSFIEINVWDMFWEITKMVIIPVALGLLFNHFFHGKIKWLDKAMPIASMAGIAFIMTIITAAGRDNLLKVGGLLILATLVHNVAGYFFGYWVAKIFKFKEKDARTIALEVGMQNAGLASGLSLAMGKLSTTGLAPAIFGPVMNITGSALASWWHNHPPPEDKEAQDVDIRKT